MIPTIARVRAEAGTGGGDLRLRNRSQAIARMHPHANTMNR